MREDLRMDWDDLLVGHWSSHPFSYGAMEASELGFIGDGRGWSAWFNANDLCVTRFNWTCPEPGMVEMQTEWMVEGTLGGEAGVLSFATMEPALRVHEVTRHHYVIGAVVPMPGADPLAAISFEEPVEFCHDFARGARRISPEEDPAHGVPPHW
ncbi:MAG TPA: hypothetical protein VFH94_26220 [Streptomyces sp.]|nr:hypothetical protein [Streptomyces sp.]